MNVFDTLTQRGFIKQTTHEGLQDLLGKEKVTFYIGFDPTADSLHVGHFVQLMAMAHMQRAGHLPIALVGGGTAMVGDPSGKTDMRRMMTRETIIHNSEKFRKQMRRFLNFSNNNIDVDNLDQISYNNESLNQAIMVDNSEWLLDLNYISFLREVGSAFSVNKMLTSECYKQRLEKGLTFLEFNYMLMQAYDFLVLNRKYKCTLQLGGDDQWSNILAGADLIRRKEQKLAYGMTFALLTKSDGKKMGKTESGALWLDPEKTSPYEFYQYWRNVNDADVKKCLSLLTFLPMEEVNRLSALKDTEINQAKKVLAFEVTKQVHGESEAAAARDAAEALFGGGVQGGSIPLSEITPEELAQNAKVIDLLIFCGLTSSRGEGRRLIAGGGIGIDGVKVEDEFQEINPGDFKDGEIMIKKGKKVYHKVKLA